MFLLLHIVHLLVPHVHIYRRQWLHVLQIFLGFVSRRSAVTSFVDFEASNSSTLNETASSQQFRAKHPFLNLHSWFCLHTFSHICTNLRLRHRSWWRCKICCTCFSFCCHLLIFLGMSAFSKNLFLSAFNWVQEFYFSQALWKGFPTYWRNTILGRGQNPFRPTEANPQQIRREKCKQKNLQQTFCIFSYLFSTIYMEIVFNCAMIIWFAEATICNMKSFRCRYM